MSDLNEYERLREERIRRNAEQLSKLEITQLIPKTAPKPRPVKRKTEPEAPRRVSLRQQGLDPSGAEAQTIKQELEEEREKEHARRRRHYDVEALADVLRDDEPYSDIEDEDDKGEKQDYLDRFWKNLAPSKSDERINLRNDKLNLTVWDESYVCKMTAKRAYSLHVHSRTDILLTAAGDTAGNYSLWRFGGETDPNIVRLEPHAGAVSAICSHPEEQDSMYSSSHDSTIRRLDLNKQEFLTEWYDKEEEHSVSGITHFGARNILFCTKSGHVGSIDCRSRRKKEWLTQLHELKVSTVSVSNDGTLFATSCNDRTARIYDLRRVRKSNDYLYEYTHGKAVSGAQLHPEKKDMLLTTSYDNTLSVFRDGKTLNRYKHDNNTGRWISNFRAQWHPYLENIFVCGSKRRPHGLDTYDVSSDSNLDSGRITSDYLTAIPARHAFHPTGSLVGGTASGKIYLFTPQKL